MNFEAFSLPAIEPCVRPNTPWYRIIRTAAEEDAKCEARGIKCLAWEPPCGHHRGASEPFSAMLTVTNKNCWRVVTFYKSNSCGGLTGLERIRESSYRLEV